MKRQGIQVHSYIEKQLETAGTCDQCSLEFAVYGVFASCPDCGQLNALTSLLGITGNREEEASAVAI